MKKIIFGTIILAFVFTTSCDREQNTDFIQYNWKLQSVSENGITHAIHWSEADLCIEDAYTLIFINDTIFQLNTGVNKAMGIYHLSEANLEISQYREMTSVHSEDKIDQLLPKCIPTVHTYKIKGNSLILIGDGCRIRLTR